MVTKLAEMRAVRMLGRITRRMMTGQDAPNERAASVRVLRSIDLRPASIERYANGSTSTT